jgi:hypothetical protein
MEDIFLLSISMLIMLDKAIESQRKKNSKKKFKQLTYCHISRSGEQGGGQGRGQRI